MAREKGSRDRIEVPRQGTGSQSAIPPSQRVQPSGIRSAEPTNDEIVVVRPERPTSSATVGARATPHDEEGDVEGDEADDGNEEERLARPEAGQAGAEHGGDEGDGVGEGADEEPASDAAKELSVFAAFETDTATDIDLENVRYPKRKGTKYQRISALLALRDPAIVILPHGSACKHCRKGKWPCLTRIETVSLRGRCLSCSTEPCDLGPRGQGGDYVGKEWLDEAIQWLEAKVGSCEPLGDSTESLRELSTLLADMKEWRSQMTEGQGSQLISGPTITAEDS